MIEQNDAADKVPPHLRESGAVLYGSAVEQYDLSIPEVAALLQAAETIDILRIIEDSTRLPGRSWRLEGRPHTLEPLTWQSRSKTPYGAVDLRPGMKASLDAIGPLALSAGTVAS